MSEKKDTIPSEEQVVGTFVCDCPACATKIYFEQEDLADSPVLACPACGSEIELNVDMLDKFRVEEVAVESLEPEAPASYVVDCPRCDAVVYFEESDIGPNGALECPACECVIDVDTDVLSAYAVVDDAARLAKKRKLRKIFGISGGLVAGIAVVLGALTALSFANVASVGGKWVSKNFYDCVYYYAAVSNQSSVQNYSYYGFDPSKKASAQKFEASTEVEYETWDDYFKSTTNDMLSTYFAISKAAEEAGMALEKEDLENVQSAIDQINESAESANQSFAEYTKATYGGSFTEKSLRKYVEMVTLCQNYYSKINDGLEVTDKQVKDEYKSNPTEYNYVDFYYGYIEIKDGVTEKQAISQAKKICSAKSADAFTKLAKKYSVTTSEVVGIQNGLPLSSLPNYLAEDTAKFLKKAKVGDTCYTKGTTGDFVELVMLSKAQYRDNSKDEKTGKPAWFVSAKEKLTNDIMTDTIETLRKDSEVKSGFGSLIWKY